MRILVLHNAIQSTRQDDLDTVAQATQIEAYLRELGHDTHIAACRRLADVEALLQQHQPDHIFNLVESFQGSDQHIYLVRGLIEAYRIPCTGCHAQALLLTGNKLLARQIMAAHGIATPVSSTEQDADPQARYIVKSVSEHASWGIDAASVVNSASEAQALIQIKQQQYGGRWFAESYIEGREINIALFDHGGKVCCLPAAEICFTHPSSVNIVDYAAKWHEASDSYHHTARVFLSAADTPLYEQLQQIALRCWEIFDLSGGYARVDMRVDARGVPFVLEINANPCLHADAGFMAAAQQGGIAPRQLIHCLLGNTNHEHPHRSAVTPDSQ